MDSIRSPIILLSLALFSSCSSAVFAQNRFVNPDGVCGGSAPCYTTIQAAINTAANNHVIEVQAGTYTEDLVITGKTGVTLRSATGKDNTTIQLVGGVGIDIDGTADNFTLGGAANQGFTIVGDTGATTFTIQLANGPDGVTISYNTINLTGNASQGISIGAAGASNLTISNNGFWADNGDGCIWGPAVAGVTVSTNTFNDPAGSPSSGYAVQFSGVTGASSIDNNTITGYANGILISNGAETSGLVINANPITDCINAIRLAEYAPGTAGDMTGVDMTGNTLTDNTLGVWIGAGAHIVGPSILIRNDNTISGSTTAGIKVEGVATIIDNDAADSISNNSIGILIDDGTALIENNDLTGNTAAAIRVTNDATVDAGDTDGANVTGLGTGTGAAGSSDGSNDLSGYGGDDASPWAIENLNTNVQPDVQGQSNDYGACASYDLNDFIYDSDDNAGLSTIEISQNPANPDPTAAASNNGPVCEAAQLDLTGGPGAMAAYDWVGPNGFSSSQQSPTVSATATTAMAGTYTLTVTDGVGCQDTDQTVVVVNLVSTAPTSAQSDRNNFCADDAGTIDLSVTGGAGDEVHWFDNSCGGNDIGTGSPLTIASPATTTTYYARYESTSGCGNSSCASVAVTVEPLPVAPTTAASDRSNLCADDAGTISLSVSDGSGDTLHWYDDSCGGNQIGTGKPLVIASPTVTTTYYVLWEISCGGAPKFSSCDSVTVTVQPAPTADADVDQTVCNGSDASLAGSATNASSTQWSTAGDGSFDNNTLLNAVYTPGAGDLTAGTVTLTLTVNPIAPCAIAALDTMIVTIQDHPTADADVDQVICTGATATMAGAATNQSSVQWTSSGTGSFDNDALLGAVYTPSAGDYASGPITLTLTANPTAPCSVAAQGTMDLDFQDHPTVDANNDQTICAGQTVQLAGSSSNASTCQWTTSGTGVFDDDTLDNAVYTPSAGDIATGNVDLTLTCQPSAPCTVVGNDTMTVTIQESPAVDAGADQAVCDGDTVSLSGSSTNSASDKWTTSGDGTFDDDTLLNAVYTPGSNDIAGGSVTLTLTSQPTAPCTAEGNDTMTVAINPNPDCTLTVDTQICPDSTDNLAGVPDAGAGATYNWTVTDGTIDAGDGTREITYATGPTGKLTLSVTVTDANNCTCTTPETSVTVLDNTDPVITKCADPQTLAADVNCQAVIPDLTGDVIATDNCGNGPVVTQDPPADTVVGVGITEVTLTATDDHRYTATCTVLVTVELGACDEDGDGVTDVIENAALNGGDANGDGHLDSGQANVASLLGVNGGLVVLIASSPLRLSSVEASGKSSQVDALEGAVFPAGVASFTISELSDVGSTVQAYFVLDPSSDADVNSFFIYGPDTDNSTPHWYEFLYDGTTGAQIDGNVITLTFVDGLRGDGDLAANGEILALGGPALQQKVEPYINPLFSVLCGFPVCGLSGASTIFWAFTGLLGMKLVIRRSRPGRGHTSFRRR